MRFTLCGARLVDATKDVARGTITIEGSQIKAIGEFESQGEVIDLGDAIVTPGFIEVHTHGGGGFALHTTNVEEIHAYGNWTPSTGVTSYLVTVVGTPDSIPVAQIDSAVKAIEDFSLSSQAAEPTGIFLEGPYINEKRRGAHPTTWLRTPDENETERILALTRGYLQLVTLAPELPGAEQMIRRLVDAGVTVSIGHTDADYEQAKQAIELGITHATHCFNAMRPLLHREPGPLAAIALNDQVRGELIADGIHVHPAMMDILVRILGPQRIVVVTDAQAGAGVSEAVFEFAGQQARVICGAARLADGTLAGSILTMDQALRNIIEKTHVSFSEAVGMLTINPARSAHTDQRKGLLQTGYDADLLIFDKNLQLQATICRGQLAFKADDCSLPLQALQMV